MRRGWYQAQCIRATRALRFWVFGAWVLLVGVLAIPAPAGADWDHPVDAPVSDPFRPPQTKFGAGNRGLEYATVGGEIVRAVDGGTVTFAGVVGRQRHVVVDHGDGLRSTYAFVASVDVVRGQNVQKGQRVATANPGVHLTARLGSTYVDPMLLMNGAEVVVRLRPGVEPPQAGSPDVPRRLSPDLAIIDAASDLTLTQQLLAFAEAADQWHHQECTHDGVAVAAPSGSSALDQRILIQVGGLGTSSNGASIGGLDHGALGYDPDNVVGFSYAGGCTPAAFGGGVGSLSGELTTSPYEPADTFQTIETSAEHLVDLITSVATARPGQPIDVAAHSLGGVVTRRAIEILQASGGLDALDVVITIGSPHGGTDLATGAVAISGNDMISTALDAIGGDLGAFHNADSVLDIAEAGGGGVVDPAPPPDGLTVIAVAGATDLVVPAGHAMWDGATNVVVPTSMTDAPSTHGDLPSMPEVQREFELALAGAAPRCVGLGEVLGSAVTATGISAIEDAVTLVAGLARWVF